MEVLFEVGGSEEVRLPPSFCPHLRDSRRLHPLLEGP
jgi:hypothetical protein